MEGEVLRWPIVRWADEQKLPSAILTEKPAFVSPSVPAEIALMLPARAGSETLPTGLEIPRDLDDEALGIFLTNPFLNLDRLIQRFGSTSVKWFANYPTVGFQDQEFAPQLADVGFDPGLEVRAATRLIKAGFNWFAVVSDLAFVDDILQAKPAAVLAMPRLSDYTAGFPSPRVRTALVEQVLEAVKEKGLAIPVLGFGETEEGGRVSLWPQGAGGLVVRPSLR